MSEGGQTQSGYVSGMMTPELPDYEEVSFLPSHFFFWTFCLHLLTHLLENNSRSFTFSLENKELLTLLKFERQLIQKRVELDIEEVLVPEVDLN